MQVCFLGYSVFVYALCQPAVFLLSGAVCTSWPACQVDVTEGKARAGFSSLHPRAAGVSGTPTQLG